jgi:hypothetical protein
VIRPVLRGCEPQAPARRLTRVTICMRNPRPVSWVLVLSAAAGCGRPALSVPSAAVGDKGQNPSGVADLREYLRRIPDGRFAAEARRVLDENSLLGLRAGPHTLGTRTRRETPP